MKLTKLIDVMCLNTINDCIENAVFSVFIKEYDKYIKDFGDAFIIQIPVDEKITYNQVIYDLIGSFEILGYLYGECPVVQDICFDLGIYDNSGNEINVILNRPKIINHLEVKIQNILNQ